VRCSCLNPFQSRGGTKTLNSFYERPILNSPYRAPELHHPLDQNGQPLEGEPRQGRRSSRFIVPVPASRKKASAAQASLDLETYTENALINEIRGYVDPWRSLAAAAGGGGCRRMAEGPGRSAHSRRAGPVLCRGEPAAGRGRRTGRVTRRQQRPAHGAAGHRARAPGRAGQAGTLLCAGAGGGWRSTPGGSIASSSRRRKPRGGRRGRMSGSARSCRESRSRTASGNGRHVGWVWGGSKVT
jgi:hypothetical protein